MAITTTSQLAPAVREYYDRLILMTAYPALVHTKFAQKRMLPKNSGDTIVFRRYSKLDTVPIPLVDGITPPGAPLSATDVKARVDFYGNFVTLTNQVMLTVEDRALNEATRLVAQNYAQTMDEITRDVLASMATVIQCSNGTNLATPTELTKEDIDGVVKTLLGNSAEMISDVIPATNAFATAPTRPAFFGFIHTDLLDDLESVSSFVSSSNYSAVQKALDYEWGSTGNVRYLYTPLGIKSAAATPVYSIPIVAKEAYACINLGSESGDFYVESLGSAGSADPLHQRATVGFQHPFAARMLNDSFAALLLATHS